MCCISLNTLPSTQYGHRGSSVAISANFPEKYRPEYTIFIICHADEPFGTGPASGPVRDLFRFFVFFRSSYRDQPADGVEQIDRGAKRRHDVLEERDHALRRDPAVGAELMDRARVELAPASEDAETRGNRPQAHSLPCCITLPAPSPDNPVALA